MNKYLIILILFALRFFGAINISYSIIIAVLIIITSKIDYKKDKIGYIILFTFITLIINYFSSLYFRGQALWQSITAFPHVFMLLFYFYLKKKDYKINEIENSVLFVSILFSLCYILQVYIYPTIIFQGARSLLYDGTGLPRIRMEGSTMIFLAYFLCLNRYLIYRKKMYIACMGLFFILFFLYGFRTFIFAVIISSFILIYKYKGFKAIGKAIIIFSIFGACLYTIPIVKDRLNIMLEKQKTETFTNEDYIRTLCFKYYTTEHFKNSMEYILGSGYPNLDSMYGKDIQNIEKTSMFYWVDLGLLGLSWMIGLPAVLCMILYSIIMIFNKARDALYINSFFIFLLLSGFTSGEFFRFGSFIPQAIALFIYYKYQHHDINNYSNVQCK